ncbi:hypothetical protein K8089_15910 [Aequorivita sp. F47161]|uniref:Holin n=1 Tax=Aequorivita vitellina TaxID=2874475 RepID=A0A9X1R027_9FLAO|nr:hypothetical protein [Aequorivita vitellina]MCG2420507.1 hypothetical protein [Aequorivita vitellina]
MNLIERYKKPTPKFFTVMRNLGIALGALGTALLTAPVTLPAAILAVATYITIVGTGVTAVSQAVVSDDSGEENKSNQD